MKELQQREYVTAWIGPVKKKTKKEKNGSLEYCNEFQGQLILGIANEGLVSKLQNMGRRDETTKGMV